MPAPLCVSLLMMGGSSLLLQVLLLRELLTSFFGNELAVSTVLASWLLLVAAGSALGSRSGRSLTCGAHTFGLLQVLLSVVVPVAILGSRFVGGRTFFPGEVVSPPVMLGLSALTVAPGCLLLGAQFAAGCRAALELGLGSRSSSIVYALESLGALIAGLLFHFVLADHFRPVSLGLVLGAANALSAVGLLRLSQPPASRSSGRGLEFLAVGLAALLVVAAIVSPLREVLDRWSLSGRWRGFSLERSVDSRFGNLALTRNGAQSSVFLDGSLLFTSDDTEAAEWTAHLPLLEHPGPRRVVIVGVSDPLVVGQVSKHLASAGTGTRLQVLEANSALLRLVRPWMLTSSPQVPVGDVRLQLAGLAPADVLLVNMPEPTTAALNRTYTREFFALVAEHLTSDGVFALSLTGGEAFVSSEHRTIHAAIHSALTSVFPQVLAIPGYRTQFLASRQSDGLTTSAQVLSRRLRQRYVRTQFVTDFSLEEALSPFRTDRYLRDLIRAPEPPNADLLPVTARNYLRLWLRQQTSAGPQILDQLTGAAKGSLWLVLAALIVGLSARGMAPVRRLSVGFFAAAFGCLAMGLQLAVMLAFQSLAGYLYHQIGILTALNMGGLALGGWLGGRHGLLSRAGRTAPLLGYAACALAYLFAPITTALQSSPAAIPAALGLLAALGGTLIGLLYPLTVALATSFAGTSEAAARVYAWDLLGGAVGALLGGLVLIPCLGVQTTAQVLGNLALAGVVLLSLARRGPSPLPFS